MRMRAKKLERVEEMFRRAVARARADGVGIGWRAYGVCLSGDGREYILNPPICPTGAVLYYDVSFTWTERLRAWFWCRILPSGDENVDAARLLGTSRRFVVAFIDGFDGNPLSPSRTTRPTRLRRTGHNLGVRFRKELFSVPAPDDGVELGGQESVETLDPLMAMVE